MISGGLDRAQHPWIDDDRLPRTQQSTSQEQEQTSRSARKRIQKKSIRNAKDSAEMARIKYQRKWGQDAGAGTADSAGAGAGAGADADAQPQQSAASRLGRHFGVGHTGNNGSTARQNTQPERERERQAFNRTATQPLPLPARLHASPPTPPRTSETQGPARFYWHDGLHQSAAALTNLSAGPALLQNRASIDSARIIPGRPSSEYYLPHDNHDLQGLRLPSFDSSRPMIKRQRSSSPARPKTANGIDSALLEVPIPHYRLGSPHFTERGTAFLHNSFHTAFSSTIDLNSLAVSNENIHRLPFPAPPGQQQLTYTPLRRSPTSWFSPSVTPALEDARPSTLVFPPSEDGNITPSMYDTLATNPDSPTWVMYAPGKRELLAATKARLVMEITSVKFLDYDLLSDFFLTYRSFMTSADLARYLLARFRWAVSQTDSTGRIVRVRTFVALRHWVLNYFMDDFEPDYALRSLFCELVNVLSLDLQQRPGGGGGDYQVLNELKKCWRRTCVLVWGSGDDPQLDRLPRPSDTASSDSGVSIPAMGPAPPSAGTIGDTAHDREIIKPGGHSYFTYAVNNRTRVPESPFSDTSVHATSCSIPLRKRSRPNFNSGKDMQEKGHAQVLYSPQKPQRRPSQRRQRSGSFSDALRDAVIAEAQPAVPFIPGGLIRGNLIPPSTANIVIPGPLSPLARSFQGRGRDADADSLLHPDAISNPAVLKILGGVRRALSTRGGHKSSFSSGHKTSISGDLRKLRENHSPARPSTVVEPHWKRDQPRSDALAAIVARSWEEQPRDDTEKPESTEAEANQLVVSPRSQVIVAKERPLGATRFNSHVSTSSQSILILDDTGMAETALSQHLRTPSSVRVLQQQVASGKGDHDVLTALALDNTAFLCPDPDPDPQIVYGVPQDHIERTTTPITSPKKSNLGAPLSPPPTAPLPPLPSAIKEFIDKNLVFDTSRQSLRPQAKTPESLPTPLSQIGLALGTPSQQESPLLNQEKLDPPVSTDVDEVDSETSPPRLLRRRPGGNLRAVTTVQDLGVLHRRQSTGSVSSPGLSSYSGSPIIMSSEFGSIDMAFKWSNILQNKPVDESGTSSVRRSSLRLLSTHSSQPNLRASFEVEFKRLASLPADDEDGDIEATLLKLEGRFQPSRQMNYTDHVWSGDDDQDQGVGDQPFENEEVHSPEVEGSRVSSGTPLTETMGASIYDISQTSRETVVHVPDEPSTPDRAMQDSSVISPEAERELKKWRRGSRVLWSPEPPLISPSSQNSHSQSGQESITAPKELAKAMGNLKLRLPYHTRGASEAASSSRTKSSFFLDEDESLGDATSMRRLSEVPSREDFGRSFFFNEEEDDVITEKPHKDLHVLRNLRPLTPPTTAGASSDAASILPPPSLLSPGPPKDSVSTPERLTPELDHNKQLNYTPRKARKDPPTRLHLPRHIPTQHTPFILAYSSSTLAAQFTLIEKDALDCIDWKDLVNLSWAPDSPFIRDWAQYTHSLSSSNNNTSSIDLIIARFNLVIKWCISSVLLCGTAEERATCITKFIHIASYSHTKLHNFATMAQITIGLLSSDLAKLAKTWQRVPQAEKDTLRQLEVLVSPVRNFAAIRAEMESRAAMLDESAVGDDKGVIPFVGVYTRDLALNAQKPAVLPPGIDSGRDNHLGVQEQLINFERYRTAASIIKGVLKLLDASSRYTIQPHNEILGRCLWLAALGDGEIASLSKGLE